MFQHYSPPIFELIIFNAFIAKKSVFPISLCLHLLHFNLASAFKNFFKFCFPNILKHYNTSQNTIAYCKTSFTNEFQKCWIWKLKVFVFLGFSHFPSKTQSTNCNREKVEFSEAFRGFCFSRLFHIYFRNFKKVGKNNFTLLLLSILYYIDSKNFFISSTHTNFKHEWLSKNWIKTCNYKSNEEEVIKLLIRD